MSVLQKLPKNQRIMVLGATGAVALFLLYRWYAARSAGAAPPPVQDPAMDGSVFGSGGGTGGGGGGGVDLSGIQSELDAMQAQLAGLPTDGGTVSVDWDPQAVSDEMLKVLAGWKPPARDTNTGGAVGGGATGGGNDAGSTAHAQSMPSWLTAAANKVKGTATATSKYGAQYLLSSPGSGGDWHTYYTAAGKIAKQVFVAKAKSTTTSHQGASVPGALQGNGAIAVVDHAVKSVAASVPKPTPKAGFHFLQDAGSRAGLSYNVVQKGGSNYRYYENGDKVKI